MELVSAHVITYWRETFQDAPTPDSKFSKAIMCRPCIKANLNDGTCTTCKESN